MNVAVSARVLLLPLLYTQRHVRIHSKALLPFLQPCFKHSTLSLSIPPLGFAHH